MTNMKRSNDVLLDKWAVVFLAVIAVGIFLRFCFLDQKSIWSDELFSLNLSSPQKNVITTLRESLRDTHPPLYPLLLRSFLGAIDYSVSAGRALSAIFGSVGIILFATFLFKWRGALNALWGGGLLAVHNMHFFYSQEIRLYGLAALLVCAGMLAWYQGQSRRSALWFAASGLFFAGLGFTYYVGALLGFIFLATGCLSAFRLRRATGLLEWVAVLSFTVPLLFLIPSFLVDVKTHSFWTADPSFRALVHLGSSLAGGKFALAMMSAAIAWRFVRRAELDHTERHLVITVLLFIAVLLVYSWTRFSLLIPRVSIIIVPMIVAVFVSTCSKLGWSNRLKLLAIGVLCFPTFFASTNAFDRRGHGHRQKELVEFISQQPSRSEFCGGYSAKYETLFLVYGHHELYIPADPRLQQPGNRCWLISTHDVKRSTVLLPEWEHIVVAQYNGAREAAYLVQLITRH